MNEPVDAVITWVDGLDPEYAQKLNFHLSHQNIEKDDAGVHPTRFNQCGEISFCVNSIFKYAPWIRNIYIVTDNQVPPLNHTFPLLKDKIKIIDPESDNGIGRYPLQQSFNFGLLVNF